MLWDHSPALLLPALHLCQHAKPADNRHRSVRQCTFQGEWHFQSTFTLCSRLCQLTAGATGAGAAAAADVIGASSPVKTGTCNGCEVRNQCYRDRQDVRIRDGTCATLLLLLLPFLPELFLGLLPIAFDTRPINQPLPAWEKTGRGRIVSD